MADEGFTAELKHFHLWSVWTGRELLAGGVEEAGDRAPPRRPARLGGRRRLDRRGPGRAGQRRLLPGRGPLAAPSRRAQWPGDAARHFRGPDRALLRVPYLNTGEVQVWVLVPAAPAAGP